MESLLEKIRQTSGSLRPVTTTVTRADGTRHTEEHQGTVLLNGKGDQSQQPGSWYVVDTSPDETPALVCPRLYLGSQDCCAPHALLPHDIRTVISVGVESPHRVPNVSYHHVPCLDLPETDLLPVISECNGIIRETLEDEGGGSVLVHCNAGVSRSTSVVMGYLMAERGWSHDTAMAKLREVRPCVRPNSGFQRQLRTLRFERNSV